MFCSGAVTLQLTSCGNTQTNTNTDFYANNFSVTAKL